jgi:type 1 fimbriae regulatory protein FimB/type 1 fimbriae regulatory protein FimE
MSAVAFRRMLTRLGPAAKMPFGIHPHMLRQVGQSGCGYSVAATLSRPQEHPAHGSIRYSELSPERFRDFLEGLGSAVGFTRRQYGHCILTGIRRTVRFL